MFVPYCKWYPLKRVAIDVGHEKEYRIFASMYKLIRNILFLFDPEWVHYFSINSYRILCQIGLKGYLTRKFQPNSKPVQAFGLTFKNLIGLGAGFDKNAKYLNELETMGFGFVEIGTVTPLLQKGNPKPRLFRLPKDKALINRMGFNNDGVDKIGERLANRKKSTLIIGGNIGKNKNTPNEDAWKDYEVCFRKLFDWVDYFVVNVSSPNTPGLRELQEKESLRKILSNLQNINERQTLRKPLLFKIAPDLTNEQIDDVIDLAMELKLDGIVATNTTISREGLSNPQQIEKVGAGGVSGLPLRQRSNEVISYIHKRSGGKLSIIGSGGIFNSEYAKEKIEAGATLLQVWTGFIYEGPAIVKKILSAHPPYLRTKFLINGIVADR